MKRVFLITAAVLIAVFLACAGCTEEKPAPSPRPVPTVATPVPTQPPTAIPTETSEAIVPLPDKQKIDLSLTKDRTFSTITLLYEGGGGEIFTNKIEMRVTTSDGKVTDYVMNNGKAPKRGDQIEAQGTRGSDRCEVWVTSAGIRYKVEDQRLIIGGAYEGN